MYQLGENVELYKELVPDGMPQYYVIVSKRGEKEYIINEVIYTFMSHFIEPNSLQNVIDTYIKLTKAKKEQISLITEQLSTFFNQITSRHWIINLEKPISERNFEPYFSFNDTIGPYKVIKLIANNETTEVYLAKRNNIRKRFVIKVLNSKKFTAKDRFEKYRKFFKNEYKYLNTFHSIYINKGLDYVDESDFSYMVLEHINGKSIFRYIRHNKPTSIERIELVLKMLKGFAIIHKNDLYHGDIHLGNVLITPKKQVKVIDFGYSNPVVVNNDEPDKKPRNGGAHAFIPPERTLRSIKRKFSAVELFQSEVYQIGLIIYYIFVNELPFKANTWKTMVDEKQSFDIETFEPFQKRKMPKAVRQIISKSLQNSPELRYKDAQHVLNEWKKLIKK